MLGLESGRHRRHCNPRQLRRSAPIPRRSAHHVAGERSAHRAHPQLRTAALPPELVLLSSCFPCCCTGKVSLHPCVRSARTSPRSPYSPPSLSQPRLPAPQWSGTPSDWRGDPRGFLALRSHPPTQPHRCCLGRLFPSRQVTILRAESLINDGTALVIYGVAVGVTVGEQTLTLALSPGRSWSPTEEGHSSEHS